jgi:hypothetical protein
MEKFVVSVHFDEDAKLNNEIEDGLSVIRGLFNRKDLDGMELIENDRFPQSFDTQDSNVRILVTPPDEEKVDENNDKDVQVKKRLNQHLRGNGGIAHKVQVKEYN